MRTTILRTLAACAVFATATTEPVQSQINVGPNNNVGAGPYSSIAAGDANTNSGAYSIIASGNLNHIGPTIAGFVGGGAANTNNGTASVLGAGIDNTVLSDYSFLGAGTFNKLQNEDGFIGSGGGNVNDAGSGGSSAIVAGTGNGVSSAHSFIGGGSANTNSGLAGVIAGGQDNVNEGDRAVIGGGSDNVVEGDYAVIPGGLEGKASLYGQFAHASGAFSDAGDAQTSVYLLRNTTSDDSWTELFLDGSSQRLIIPEDASWLCDIDVVGRSDTKVTDSTYADFFHLRVFIENQGGTTVLGGAGGSGGSSLTQYTYEFGSGAIYSYDKYDFHRPHTSAFVSVTADSSNGALKIEVHGVSGQDFRWVARVRTLEVTFP